MKKLLACKNICPVVAELKFDIANRDTEVRRLNAIINDLRTVNRVLATRVHELEEDRENAWSAIAKVQNVVTAFQAERCNSKNSKITGGP